MRSNWYSPAPHLPPPWHPSTIEKGDKPTATQTKASIVFAHGNWADGSCFQKLIPTLRAEGHDVMAAQYGLTR